MSGVKHRLLNIEKSILIMIGCNDGVCFKLNSVRLVILLIVFGYPDVISDQAGFIVHFNSEVTFKTSKYTLELSVFWIKDFLVDSYRSSMSKE